MNNCCPHCGAASAASDAEHCPQCGNSLPQTGITSAAPRAVPEFSAPAAELPLARPALFTGPKALVDVDLVQARPNWPSCCIRCGEPATDKRQAHHWWFSAAWLLLIMICSLGRSANPDKQRDGDLSRRIGELALMAGVYLLPVLCSRRIVLSMPLCRKHTQGWDRRRWYYRLSLVAIVLTWVAVFTVLPREGGPPLPALLLTGAWLVSILVIHFRNIYVTRIDGQVVNLANVSSAFANQLETARRGKRDAGAIVFRLFMVVATFAVVALAERGPWADPPAAPIQGQGFRLDWPGPGWRFAAQEKLSQHPLKPVAGAEHVRGTAALIIAEPAPEDFPIKGNEQLLAQHVFENNKLLNKRLTSSTPMEFKGLPAVRLRIVGTVPGAQDAEVESTVFAHN
ncbi:MAG: hypothetical protein AB7K24_29645, partial [Gemmataceae bacterium]